MTDDGKISRARPWTVSASKITFEDRWLKVRTDSCVTAEGAEISPYHVIVSRDWTAIVALTADLRLVLVREYRHARSAIIDGLPGGVIDHVDGDGAMDAAEAGARRELLEETGYGGGRFLPVLTVYPDPGNQSNVATGFLALNVELQATQRLEVSEALDVHLADFVEVMTALATGRLRMHAVHVAALWSAAGRILLGEGLPVTAPLRAGLRAAFGIL